jgi:serine O-acetyltransferase
MPDEKPNEGPLTVDMVREQFPQLMDEVRSRHPGFVEAVLADTRLTAAYRAERFEFRSRGDAILQAVRLAWVSDAFLAVVLYRARTWLHARRVPILPRVLHRLCIMISQVCIGDPVVIGPGLYIAHGQVVIDGLVQIGPGAVFFPWVTVGLRSGDFQGATIGGGVKIGTGAKVIGPVTIGSGATVGANAVVVDDVPPRVTVVGAPARVVGVEPA